MIIHYSETSEEDESISGIDDVKVLETRELESTWARNAEEILEVSSGSKNSGVGSSGSGGNGVLILEVSSGSHDSGIGSSGGSGLNRVHLVLEEWPPPVSTTVLLVELHHVGWLTWVGSGMGTLVVEVLEFHLESSWSSHLELVLETRELESTWA